MMKSNFNIYNNIYFHRTRKKFSSSFNDNNYIISSTNFESAFTLNKNPINMNNPNTSNQNFNNSNTNLPPVDIQDTPKQKVNKHTKSDNIYKIKLSTEKNIINLEDVSSN